jgi:cytochrome b
MPSTPLNPVRVWDLPTRLFHWLLAASVMGSVITAKVGGNATVWHFRLGYAVLALLLFRVIWGVVGGHWSRFASFMPWPGRLLRYLRHQPAEGEHLDVGHNPLGALSVLGMLTLLGVQVATGLVADDEIANTGPLISFVSGSTSSLATTWHKTWGQWLILSGVALHVVAIVFYLRVRKNNLVTPMVLGDKPLPPGVPASADSLRTRVLAAVVLLAAAMGVRWLVGLGG